MEALDVRNTLGSLLVGLLFSACLYGVICLQAYLYFRAFPKDSIATRLLVTLLVLLNALHLAFITHAQYFFLVTNFIGPHDSSMLRIWTLSLHIGTTALTVLIVQCYYAKRIWTFCGKNPIRCVLVGILVFLAFSRFGVGLAITVLSEQGGRLGQPGHEPAWLITSFAITLPTELFITLSMVYFLRRVRKDITHPDEPVVKTALLYLMHTAAIPCIITTAALVCFTALNDTLIYLALNYVMGELYTSCMLVILNSRTPVHGRGTYTGSYGNTTLINSKLYAKSTMFSDGTTTQGTANEEVSPRAAQPGMTYPPTAIAEYRAKRDWLPDIPNFDYPSTPESSSYMTHSSAGPSIRVLRALSPVYEESQDGYQDSSIRTNTSLSTNRTGITGPDMSWDSVSSQDMERQCHDIGDIQWDGHLLRWHVGQGRG